MTKPGVPESTRSRGSWLALSLFVFALAGLLFSVRRTLSAAASPLLVSVERGLSVPLSPSRATYVVVFQRADCSGRVQAFARQLRLLDLDVGRQAQAVGVLLDAPSSEDEFIQLVLQTDLDIPVQRADRFFDLRLAALGVSATPVALGFDSERTLRFVASSLDSVGGENLWALLSRSKEDTIGFLRPTGLSSVASPQNP